MAGAGNRLLVLDGTRDLVPEDPSALARELGEASRENRPDGLMLVLPPEDGGDLKMVVYNVDGSRAKTCGNGLRCIGLLAWSRHWVQGPIIQVETDAGTREVQYTKDNRFPSGVLIHVHMGAIFIHNEPRRVEVAGQVREFHVVDAGNPHAVTFVDDLENTRVNAIGSALQELPMFAGGVNVEFAQVQGGEVCARVYERGVGETESCGSGACAVAAVVRMRGQLPWPIRVRMVGGVLGVEGDGHGGVWQTGPAVELPIDESFHELLARHGVAPRARE